MDIDKLRELARRDGKQWGSARRTICIDFDGVICAYGKKGWNEGKVSGNVIEGAFEGLVTLEEAGFKVVILTARKRTIKKVIAWMKEQGFSHLEVTNVKPSAIAYIDDRGIRFTSWRDIVNYFA